MQAAREPILLEPGMPAGIIYCPVKSGDTYSLPAEVVSVPGKHGEQHGIISIHMKSGDVYFSLAEVKSVPREPGA